jgi:hypothetical protein
MSQRVEINRLRSSDWVLVISKFHNDEFLVLRAQIKTSIEFDE